MSEPAHLPTSKDTPGSPPPTDTGTGSREPKDAATGSPVGGKGTEGAGAAEERAGGAGAARNARGDLQVGIAQAALGFCVTSLGATLVMLARDLRVPVGSIAWLASAFGAGLLAAAAAGPLLLRRGPRAPAGGRGPAPATPRGRPPRGPRRRNGRPTAGRGRPR
ncbi:hypothetical protein AB0B89_19200, partial [Sphaerisporangium sp. NPDC049002]|uniref:hypothetical protein n=1 Tax=Sphaerisporangium sp. NPDC049002 TaxID=3155392 RepID=UPI0033D49353